MHNFGYRTSSFGSLNYRPQMHFPTYERPSHPVQNKSTTSIETQYLKKSLNDMEMFPIGFSELLKNQQRNIRQFKNKISREKERINEDISSFKIQFIHNLEDLRLSLHAELDRIYQGYLEKYAKFKGELLQINRLKDQMSIEMVSSTFPKKPQKDYENLSKSNAKTITNMENGNNQLRKYQIMKYVAQLQKERILPLRDHQREIVILTEYDNGFYQPKQFQRVLDELKELFKDELRRIYDKKYEFIRETESITFKEEEDKILDQVKQQINFPVHSVPKKNAFVGSPLSGNVGMSQQSAKYQWVENLKLVQNTTIKSLPDQILCGISMNGHLIFGGKSGKIYVHSKDGNQQGILREHTASICTLAIMDIHGKQFLVSGSDHGCSSVIIWDVQKMKKVQKFQNHRAAVTAIIDLKDNIHILSGSYDKKLNIYNVETCKFQYTLPSNKTEITGAVINKSGSKIITCGLQDKNIHVWQISRSLAGQVQTLFLEKKIPNDSVICSIVASNQSDEIVVGGTKDGKVRIFNIDKSQSIKTIDCSHKHIIELVLVERQTKPKYPIILAWPYRQQKILIVSGQNGNIEQKPTRTYLEYGCGISPKCFLTERGRNLWSVSHQEKNNEIISYRLQDDR